MFKPTVRASVGVTVALLPIIYFTVYQVLTSSGFSNDLKAMVVGTVIGALLGSITGFWFGGTNDKSTNPNPPTT